MTIAVITGAASGIGAKTRARLEAQGHDIIGIDLQNAEVIADLSSAEGRAAAISETLEKCSGRIDRLVLAAGVGGHVENGALVAKVNYFGTAELLDGFKDALSAVGGRCVVIGSNTAQLRVDPGGPMVEAMLAGDEKQALDIIGDMHGAQVYATTKHAITRAVRRRAAEWGAEGITLNAIMPGITETPMLNGVKNHPTISKSLAMIPIPKTRFARPDEIAGTIEFMLSDTAEYMQGSVIYVDGGTDAQLRPDAF